MWRPPLRSGASLPFPHSRFLVLLGGIDLMVSEVPEKRFRAAETCLTNGCGATDLNLGTEPSTLTKVGREAAVSCGRF
jgi:hypothetical protein